MRIVLPTFSVYAAHRELEPLFAFREEGLLGVIRDLVLLSGGVDGRCGHRYSEFEELLEQLLFEYENNVELRMEENTMRKSDYAGFALELGCEQLDLEVQDMMRLMFLDRSFEVCKQRWRWLGADLLTTVTFFR